MNGMVAHVLLSARNYYSAFVGGLIRAMQLQSLANEGRV